MDRVHSARKMGWGHGQERSGIWEQNRQAGLGPGLGLWGSDSVGPGSRVEL